MSLGLKLRQIRKEKKLSQIEVAEKAAFFAQIMLAIHTLYYQRLMILKKYETGQLSIMKN